MCTLDVQIFASRNFREVRKSRKLRHLFSRIWRKNFFREHKLSRFLGFKIFREHKFLRMRKIGRKIFQKKFSINKTVLFHSNEYRKNDNNNTNVKNLFYKVTFKLHQIDHQIDWKRFFLHLVRSILRHFHPRFHHGQCSLYCVRLKKALQL